MCTHKYAVSSISSIDRALSGATIPDKSGPGSKRNKKVDCIYPKLQHHWSFTIRAYSVVSKTLIGWVLPLCRGVIGVFYQHSWYQKKKPAWGKKKKYYRTKIKKRPTPSHPLKKIKRYAVSWSKES